MLKIFYKSTCSTCRNALALIKENSNEEVELIEYMSDTPTQKELQGVVKMLGIKAEDLVRKKEKLYKEKYAGKKLTGREWIRVMAKNPILIQRPIVIDGDKAIIGRPADTVVDFVNKKITRKNNNYVV
jgi:arsenate reductase (glutaredoxin)